MNELLNRYAPTVGRLEEAPILSNGKRIGWHSVFVAEAGRALGGGCGKDLNRARRVAIAEIIERGVFRELFKDASSDFKFEDFPTSCGFAAGFDEERTKFRAVAEAVERWALSQWIDYGYALKSLRPSELEIGELAAFFQSQFDEVLFFQKDLKITCENKILSLRFGVCVGLKDGGAFPGARVCSVEESPWEHCLIEAWRHTLIAKESMERDSSNRNYRERVVFFSSNAKAALEAIQAANRQDEWPKPRLAFLKKSHSAPVGSFVWRALCADYVGWHVGGHDRFVY